MADPQIDEFAGKSLEELKRLQASGQRRLFALEMGNLADMRVAAHYEPYSPDSDFVLDRNSKQIQRLRDALKRVAAAISQAEPR